jgi:hypothetical protein
MLIVTQILCGQAFGLAPVEALVYDAMFPQQLMIADFS